MSTVVDFHVGTWMLSPSSSSEESKSELEADSMHTDPARCDPVSSVFPPSLEDGFLGYLAV